MGKRKYKRGGRRKQRGGNIEVTQPNSTVQNNTTDIKNNLMSMFAHCSYDLKMKFISSILLASVILYLSSFFATSKSSFNSGIIGVSSLLAAAIFAWGLYSKSFIVNGQNQVNIKNIIKMMIPLLMVIPVLGIQIYLNSDKEKVMKQIAENMPHIYVMNFVTYVLIFIHIIFMVAFLCKCTKIGNVIIGTSNTILFFCLSLFSTLLSVTVLQYVNSFGTDG
mgnify:CR=1 FL=1|tara:strand:- start:4671 stop:5333 length:663 start_codon:yes stop_codon:yes gene_type:complete